MLADQQCQKKDKEMLARSYLTRVHATHRIPRDLELRLLAFLSTFVVSGMQINWLALCTL